ncbi:transcriptional repressor TCF25-domain-containing protein [Mycena olivaceomarginata]|nr:transcriptional repressor TCF25-domain-containing protein [Mycena olivaceomarginata]
MKIVYSGNLNGFYGLLRKFPWHGDTLLSWRRCSDTEKAVEYAQAVELLTGRYSHTSGPFSDRSTLQPVWIASTLITSRTVLFALPPGKRPTSSDLQRRGCVRPAFEFARLLLSLDPAKDPHGALLRLDFLAVKTSMSQWLLDMFDLYSTRRSRPHTKDARADPSLLLGWSHWLFGQPGSPRILQQVQLH